jgi:hypothetical protein
MLTIKYLGSGARIALLAPKPHLFLPSNRIQLNHSFTNRRCYSAEANQANQATQENQENKILFMDSSSITSNGIGWKKLTALGVVLVGALALGTDAVLTSDIKSTSSYITAMRLFEDSEEISELLGTLEKINLISLKSYQKSYEK